MMGTPSSVSSCLHSSLCCFVTRTVRLLYFSTSSAVFVCDGQSLVAWNVSCCRVWVSCSIVIDIA